jgi:hypothetical protein
MVDTELDVLDDSDLFGLRARPLLGRLSLRPSRLLRPRSWSFLAGNSSATPFLGSQTTGQADPKRNTQDRDTNETYVRSRWLGTSVMS